MMKQILTSEEQNFLLVEKQWSFEVPPEIENMKDCEKMLLIRSRKRQNQETARKFFGSDIKIDIPLKMIRKFKLPAIMESDLPLTYFVCFLIKCQGVENLFFCLEVEKFKETKFDNFESKRSFAQRIFNTFMENGLPMQINTNNKIIENVRETLKSSASIEYFENVFDAAYVDIYSMLENVYADFERNDFFLQMLISLTSARESEKLQSDTISEISTNSAAGSGSIYPMKAYYTALDLITFTVGCMEKIFDDKIASKRISVNRHKTIRRMVISFCEQRLKMECPDSTMNLRQSLLTDSTAIQASSRASLLSNHSAISNISQSNSTTTCSLVGGKRKDELDMF